MNGLEDVGIPGRQYLTEALSNSEIPLKAIEEFQMENGILLPSLRVMLPLLDLHGVRRLQFHNSVLEELKDKLLNQIQKMGKIDPVEKQKKLKELLLKSFPVVKVPSLQSVVMTILKNLDHVDDKYLKQLVADKDLYSVCDVSVKRQIWQEHQSLFGDEVSPLFSQYIKEKDTVLLNHTNMSISFFNLSTKQRRQNEVIQELVKMIGKNVLLYDICLQFLRTLFLRTKNIHYCTLRVELLMALHDLEVQDITTMDPCHKFAWCLDACIRERTIEPKRSRELQGFLEGVKRGQEQFVSDLSLCLADPYAINFLATSAMKILNHLIGNENLPRDNSSLTLILRMLNLGLHAWDILDSQVYREPKLDVDTITKFIPILMSFIVDDQVRHVNSKLPQDDRESALAIIEHCGPPPDLFQKFVSEDRLAAILAIYYTFQICRQKDKQAIMRVLGSLDSTQDNRFLGDLYMHQLIVYFTTIAEEFSNEDFCIVVFDELFLTSMAHSNVVHHFMKLIWYVFPHLPAHRLDMLMKTLDSFSIQNEVSKTLYKQLEERVKESGLSSAIKRQNTQDVL